MTQRSSEYINSARITRPVTGTSAWLRSVLAALAAKVFDFIGEYINVRKSNDMVIE